MLENFAQHLSKRVPVKPEISLHPHHPDERAELFSGVDGGAGELETLNFLNALVYLFKPSLALETGTGSGLATAAIASAMQANGLGHVHSVELDEGTRVNAGQTIARVAPGLVDRVTLHQGDSREFIARWDGPPFDFVFFDSLVAFRHEEFAMLLDSGRLAPGAVCAFHDTSRLRGSYFHDYNPEMIAALDYQSAGRQWLESGLSRGLRVIRL